MPHRVTNFFKSSTTSLETKVTNLTKTAAVVVARGKSAPRRSGSRPRISERIPSYASSTDDVAEDVAQTYEVPPPYAAPVGRMAETSRRNSFSSESHNRDHPHHRRISFPSLHLGRSSKDAHAHTHASLDWKLESPPVIFYGDSGNSTGAIVSGQLFLNVTREGGLDMASVNATLSIHVSHKKPYAAHCHDCAAQVTELRNWAFLDRPLHLAKGKLTRDPGGPRKCVDDEC